MIWFWVIFFVAGVVVCAAIEGGVLWATERLGEAEKTSRFRKLIRFASTVGILLVFVGFSIYAYFNQNIFLDGLKALVP